VKNIKEIFIQNLIKKRSLSGLTQEELAEAAKVGLKTYQKYEYGKAFPTPETMSLIADALKTTVSELFWDKSKSQNRSEADRLEAILKIIPRLINLEERELNTIISMIDKAPSQKMKQAKSNAV
jgi:transcriptional regulator with XRE-family HTH domain